MNHNRLLLLISFLLMCQLNRANLNEKSKLGFTRQNDCLNFVNKPPDFVNVENFRSNVKLELKQFNCTNPTVVNVTEADLENPKKDSSAISSDYFCTSVKNIASRSTLKLNSSLFPNLDHLQKKILTNQTLCIVVCTKDLNETLWPYCEVIRNLLGAFAENVPSKGVTKPSQSETGNNAIIPSVNSENSQKKDLANPLDSVKNPKNEPANPADLNNDVTDPADSGENQKSNQNISISKIKIDPHESMKKEGLNTDNHEDAPVKKIPNSAPSKSGNAPDSSKKSLQPGTINASNQSGEHSLLSVNGPSKSLPQTAIVAGTSNLRPENDESHYFIYFVVMSILCIFCYIGIYNKKKILALMIEGRKQKDRRRHASAGYRKLNTNLEEVMPLGTPAPATDSLIY